MSDETPAEKLTMRERINQFRPSVITGGLPTMPLMVLFGLNAVDELDSTAFSILVPNIRDHFNLSIQGVLTLTSLVAFAVLFLEIPLSHMADRRSRVKIATIGAAAWGSFSVFTGLAPSVGALGIARTGAGLGRAVNGSTHNSLIADWYPPDVRPGVFAIHRSANSVGQFAGPLLAGALAFFFGWRAPFLLFSIPTFILLFWAWKLKDPVRGGHERSVAGADSETIDTEEQPASLSEAFRILWGVRSIRRIWLSLPIVAVALVGIAPLVQLFYEEEFGLNELERGFIAAAAEPAQLIGYFIGIPFATKLMRRDPGLLMKFVAVMTALTAGSLLLLILAQNLALAIASQIVLAGARASVSPGLAAAFSLAIPPRVRSVGFSIGNLFIVPALFAAPIVGGFADSWGMRPAMLLLIPVLLVGSAMLGSSGQFMARDIEQVRTSTVAMSEVRAARLRGESKLLLVKDLDVAYGQTQVLFGVDFEVDEGEIIALLGTNGAGKSTLLKAISGLVEAQGGTVFFDGENITHLAPNDSVSRGLVQVPGGKGVFPGLTVAENLRIAGWLYRRDDDHVKEATAKVLEYFPALEHRWDQPAGNLSGGEQQMLTLGMAFIEKPRLLMIDELSLGLAPVIVEQLIKIVEAIRDQGTTIIVVEQSVNVALTIAETAYFMEKGEIRFNGPTADLLERGDILRSVFLEGAGSMEEAEASSTAHAEAASTNGSTNGAALPATVAANGAPEVQKPVLQVRGLTKAFGGVQAVSEVSFDLLDGEIIGIIGPNGAGKTTVFDLISGFLSLDEGGVYLHGTDVTSMAPDGRARAGLGRSFQDAKLFPALTVKEAIANAFDQNVVVKDPIAAAVRLPIVQASEARIAEEVEELIELMGLDAFRDKFIGELSTGSRRIVDLACIMGMKPKVLLFDEPSSGIAQRETEALGPLLLRIREATGAALLVIEHDMPLITSIADSMIALDLGRVITQGTPDEVIHDPQVVASYLGTNEEAIHRSGSSGTAPAADALVGGN